MSHGPDDGTRMTDEEGLEVLKAHDVLPICQALGTTDAMMRENAEMLVRKGDQGFADTTVADILPDWIGPPNCVDAVMRATVSRSTNFAEREGLDAFDHLVGSFTRGLMTGIVLATGHVPQPHDETFEEARTHAEEHSDHPIYRALEIVGAKAGEHGHDLSDDGPGVMMGNKEIAEVIPDAFGDVEEYREILAHLAVLGGYSAAVNGMTVPETIMGLFGQAMEVGYEVAKQEAADAS
jgi:hypothetical protein